MSKTLVCRVEVEVEVEEGYDSENKNENESQNYSTSTIISNRQQIRRLFDHKVTKSFWGSDGTRWLRNSINQILKFLQ